MPQRIIASSVRASVLRIAGGWIVGKHPGIGGRLPTLRLMTRNSAMIAAWFVVME
jgi:hypothetical protein